MERLEVARFPRRARAYGSSHQPSRRAGARGGKRRVWVKHNYALSLGRVFHIAVVTFPLGLSITMAFGLVSSAV